MEIKIRKPKREEYQECVNILNSEADLWNKDIFTEEELKILNIGNDKLEELIESEEVYKYLVAEVDENIAGFLMWNIKLNNIGWISRINTLPKYQGKGVGKKLIEEVEKEAKEMNLNALALETQKKATWAVNFHLANGYKILNNKDINNPPFLGITSRPVTDDLPYLLFGKKAKDFKF